MQFTVVYSVKSSKIKNREGHGTVYFTVWWYVAPTIVNTFLESYDFGGKTIVLFASSGGSGFGKAAEKLKSSCADAAVIKEGKILNGKHSKEELAAWVEKVRNQ
ncbi:flavodoxin [Anaerostipes caccae]|uniref:flavodoxin n=1 Tax=Anaerostipes caccae TaxID=105841 RepID=UPI00399509AD